MMLMQDVCLRSLHRHFLISKYMGYIGTRIKKHVLYMYIYIHVCVYMQAYDMIGDSFKALSKQVASEARFE